MEKIENTKYTVRGKQEILLAELKKNGCRLTNQRKLLIDIILKDDCCCCKEIYYQAIKQDPSIGIATVYRMVKMLADMGVLSSRLFKISYDKLENLKEKEAILLDHENVIRIQEPGWYEEVKAFLKQKGYLNDGEISIVIKKAEPAEREEDCGD